MDWWYPSRLSVSCITRPKDNVDVYHYPSNYTQLLFEAYVYTHDNFRLVGIISNQINSKCDNSNAAKELILGVAGVMENCQIKGKPKLARSSLQTLMLLQNLIFWI